jgi:hypothetical protein
MNTDCVSAMVHPLASVIISVYVVVAEGETTTVLVVPDAGFHE